MNGRKAKKTENGQRSKSIRHTALNAPEPVRALTVKCGTVGGQIKAPVTEKVFRPWAHRNNRALNVEGVDGQMRKGGRPNKSPSYGKSLQAVGNRQQATGNRQQATGNRQQAIIHIF
jgi:hypothetical protein